MCVCVCILIRVEKYYKVMKNYARADTRGRVIRADRARKCSTNAMNNSDSISLLGALRNNSKVAFS